MAGAPDCHFAPAKSFTFAADGFYHTLKKAVIEHFASRKITHKVLATLLLSSPCNEAPASHVILFILNVVLLLASLRAYTATLSVLFAVVHGILRALLVVQTTHAGTLKLCLSPSLPSQHLTLHFSRRRYSTAGPIELAPV